MKHMVLRDSASSNRGEDREVPSIASSDRDSSRDRSVTSTVC